MKTRKSTQVALAALFTLGMIACGEPLKDAQVIEEPRTLAVQIEAEDGSATPAAGEDAIARIVFAGTAGPQEVHLAYRICEAADSARGVPYCSGPVYEEGVLDAVDSLAEVEFSVPEDASAGSRFAVLGVACVTSSPSLAEDPNDWSCDGPDAPLAFSFDARVGGDERNENPDFSDVVIEVDGQVAPLESASLTPSCVAGTPEVGVGEKTRVAIDFGPSAREEGEWFQVSHFATSGAYERQFTIIEPDEELTTEIEWEAGSAGASKHYLVVRDGLGGVSFTTFSVCVE